MPYLALDLDAREKCELVARACDARPGDVLWGLTGLWLHVWRTESATVPMVVLAGCFGAHPGMPDALEAFGFIERTPEGIRIRGADRYLRIRQAQREGGRRGRAKSSSPVGDLAQTHGANKVSPRSTLKSTSRSRQALTASSEQRTAIKEEALAAKPRKAPATPDATPDPRFHPLKLALFAAFEKARGTKYEPTGRDFKAISNLLAKHEPAAIEAKWLKALALTHPPVANVFELDGAGWNRAAGGPAPPSKGAAWQQPGATDWKDRPKSFAEELAGEP